MRFFKSAALVVAIMFFCLATTASAAILTFSSDLVDESNNLTGTNVLINPHPLWFDGFSDGQWISYALTGNGQPVSPPNTTTGTPTAIFSELLPAGTISFNVTTYADDTTSIVMYNAANPGGLLLKAPNPIQDGACADGPIACEVGEGYTTGWIATSGLTRLDFGVEQRGGGPFGLNYQGQANVPEPATGILLGGALLVLGLLRRANRRK